MPKNQDIITELLRQGTPVTFQASGPSMNPTIRNGETVRIRPLQPSDIRIGTVILYKINGRLVLHRLVINQKRTKQVFVVGDAAIRGGDWVSIDEILGVGEWVQRRGQTRLLDTWRSRKAGRIRFATRPLRRMLVWTHATAHAHTSTPPS